MAGKPSDTADSEPSELLQIQAEVAAERTPAEASAAEAAVAAETSAAGRMPVVELPAVAEQEQVAA